MSGGRQEELNTLLIRKIQKGVSYAVDGLRHVTDYQSLKKHFGKGFYLVYIEPPAQLRWKRLRKARRYRSWMAFREADRHPVEQRTKGLKSRASVRIVNRETKAKLYRAMDDLLVNIRKGETP